MSKIGGSSKIQRLLKESSFLCHSGNLIEAKKIYQDLLKLIPNHPEVLGNLGTIELQEGHLEIGISYLTQALEKNPAEIKFIINLANGLIENNRANEALNYLEAAEKLKPNLINVLYNKARALKAVNKFSDAILYLDRCLKIDPKNYLVLVDHGFLHNLINNYSIAIESYSNAIKVNPDHFMTYYNRGIAYENSNDLNAAIKDYNYVVQKNPQFEPALFNMCGVFIKQKNFIKALNLINALIATNPTNEHYLIKKSFIYEEIKDFDKAIDNYDLAIQLNPQSNEAKAKKSYRYLALDLFNEGWKLYENRFWDKLIESKIKPLLTDFNTSDKTIFIWTEQGIGDQIIYASLLLDAFKTKNKFYVSVDSRLISLFKRSFSQFDHVTFISADEKLIESKYDFHLPIGSLGKFFRNSIQDFDTHPIAYLKADQREVDSLKKKLKKEGHKVCGISWKSNNKDIGEAKTLSLTQLLPILSIPNTIFIDLQYGDNSEEKEKFLSEYGIEIKSINEIDNYNNLDGLASLIDACDYIVTISNVTAHIAGALYKETYLLLPYAFGKIWYWGESRDYSLWYPAVKIYRNTKSHSWDETIDNLSKKIRAR
jgi:tetratricopeptide (TPR) repeat protein